jgi:GT2 family glycosyltransferase
MLEVSLRLEDGRASTRLYLDPGPGFDEASSIQLTVASETLSKRLFRVERRLHNLRFDPLDRPGRFSVLHFRIAWLAPFFAQDRLLRRLARHRYAAHALSPRALRHRLRTQAAEAGRPWLALALEQYDATFARHRQPSQQVPRVYRDWLAEAERSEPSPQRVRRLTAKLRQQPLVSILLPTYNTPPRFLRACVDSVRAQTYPHWQLCIADDGSTRTETRALLRELAVEDARIQLKESSRNLGIAGATNRALAAARGELCALLDHDDCLAPNALYHLVRALNRHPQASLFYSDEDKLDAQGERCEPHFKPDWNPDLLLAQNYVNHLAVYRTDLLRALGGLRGGLDGSQDHDLLLRAWRRLGDPAAIVRIPRILYHWRACEGSTAASPGHKPATAAAGLRSLQAHLAAVAPAASVEPGPIANSYRVRWPLPSPPPLVSVLLPTRDRVDLLEPCVSALLEGTDYHPVELLIIDNASQCRATLAFLERIREDSRVRVLRWPGRFNFSAIINSAAREARGELLLLLNNDVTPLHRAWLTELVRQAVRPEIGCVGAKLHYPDGRVQHGGVILGIGGVAGHAHKHLDGGEHGYFGRLQLVQNLSAVTGACMMVRRAVFDAVGGFDAERLPVSFNDVDFCLRVREAGYRNLWTPEAELCHRESASRGADEAPHQRARAAEEQAWMRRRWGRRLRRDPAYNPNLSLEHEDFSLR